MFKYGLSLLLTAAMVAGFLAAGGPALPLDGKQGVQVAVAAPLAAQVIEAKVPVPPDCLLSQWHFIINQLNNASSAPASIIVNWSSPPGGSTTVPLTSVTNKTASYRVDAPAPGVYPVSATATIYDGWDGIFTLSLACPETTTTTTTTTTSPSTTTSTTTTTATSTTTSPTTTTTTSTATSPTTTTTTSQTATSSTTSTASTATTLASTSTTKTATTSAGVTTTTSRRSTTTSTATTGGGGSTDDGGGDTTTTTTAATTTASVAGTTSVVIPVPVVVAPTPVAAPSPAAEPAAVATTTVAGVEVLPRAGGEPSLPMALLIVGFGLSALGAMMRRFAR